MKRRKGGRGEEGEEVREKREGRGRGAEGGRSLKVLYHKGLSIHIPGLSSTLASGSRDYPCLTVDLLLLRTGTVLRP